MSICTLLRSRETWAISERCTVQFPPVERCRLETDGVESKQSAAAKVVNFQQDNDLCLWRFSLAHSRIAQAFFFYNGQKQFRPNKRILLKKKYSTYFCAKLRKLVFVWEQSVAEKLYWESSNENFWNWSKVKNGPRYFENLEVTEKLGVKPRSKKKMTKGNSSSNLWFFGDAFGFPDFFEDFRFARQLVSWCKIRCFNSTLSLVE